MATRTPLREKHERKKKARKARMLQAEKPRRELDKQIDQLEAKISELRVLYEQYFVDVLPMKPEKEQKEIQKTIRTLLKAPFKNSQTRFRLRQTITRYQTYATYWERVNKQREEGTYCRDVFKAEMRERMLEEDKMAGTARGAAEKGLQQLYNSYETALRKSGANTENVNFDAFRKKLMQQARELKKNHGVQKLHYKIAMKDGKVVIKASAK